MFDLIRIQWGNDKFVFLLCGLGFQIKKKRQTDEFCLKD